MSVVLLTFGGLISLLNVNLSILRVPLLRWRGLPPERHVSGIPLLGTVLIALAWWRGLDSASERTVAACLLLIDTGGPHWFLLSLAWHAWRRREETID